uniref:Protein translocase subunit SecA n=1 Tax=Daucus carota subsp. sativus TaxID=79200 RepID=A0A166HI64_DAUCS
MPISSTVVAPPSNPPALTHLSSLSSSSTSLLSLTHHTKTASRARTKWAAHGKLLAAGPGPRRPITAMASLGGLLGGIFKGTDTGESTRQQYGSSVAAVNKLENEVSGLSDAQLRERTSLLKERATRGDSLDTLLPEAFAIVREASKRVLGLRPFDVQLIGGMVLHKGEIAEMRTGEGKTLVAVLPAYLNALSGKGVYVVTVNDYLARRDCEWVGQVPRFLGLKVGLIQQNMTSEQRRENYLCDITYVTNSELGFDYLRDNLATENFFIVQSVDELVMRKFNYCVIDEVDSILIDEARTPLIISGPADKPSDRYYKAAKIAAAFEREIHYTVDEKQKSVLITEQGYVDAEEILDVKDLYDPREQWASYLLNAIKAKELFLRDVNYIIRAQEVLIVDEFTGRVMQGRRWSDGLHQAVEAKEGLPIQNETVTLASISYQNFFLQFSKLCGMTGTAATESAEFESIYKLKVTIVPTNRAMIRKDDSDVVFKATSGKWRAVVAEISNMHKTGRPVLVGTTSVEQSDTVSMQLHEAGISHEVLNAKPENVEREAEIVAQSGRLGSVTIATNMAGRGTDIILGGNAEFMARLKLREMLMPRVVKPDEGLDVSAKKPILKKTWKVNESLFPCELSKENFNLAEEAVELAVKTWGQSSLTELEAEERLSYSCEKGPVQDEVIAKLRDAFLEIGKEYKVYTDEEKKKVVSAGGLHVVGTERHESRRIDNQLRGRSGRQGDPGSSRFFLSLEDNIFRIFGGDRIQGLMRAFRVEDLPIESKMLTKALDEAQRKVENYFFDIRKQLFEYDEVLNSQRDRVYTERRRALESDDLQPLLIEYAELTMDDILEANIGSDAPKENWDLQKLVAKVQQYCNLLSDLTPDLLASKCSNYEELRDYLRLRGREAYLQKREIVEKEEAGLMKEAERFLILSNIDRLWKEQLQALKFVQQAVGLRGYAQRDPLIEYKLEGYNLFIEMMAQIRRNVIYSIYQFKYKMVKEKEQADNSSKLDTNGKGGSSKTLNPVGAVETSSSTVTDNA